MSAPLPGIVDKVAALRLAFDRTFAEPMRIETDAREALLAIRVGAENFAIRLSEVAGLHADKKITPIPGGHASLMGIAGFRGAVLPVYRLHVLLGLAAPPAAGGAPRRWLVIAAAAPVALAFDAFEGQRRVPQDAIVRRPSRAEHNGCVREFVKSRKVVAPILHLPSVLDAIKAERPAAEPREEP